MIVLVCGSREWSDRATMRRWLEKLVPGTVVVHGAARGADTMTGELASELGFDVRAYPADWTRHGKAAGPIRNREMLDEERPECVLAFTDTLARAGKLSGTGDCVAAANERGIRATVIPSSSGRGSPGRAG